MILDIFAQNAHTLEGGRRWSWPCCSTACLACGGAPRPGCRSRPVASARGKGRARRSSRPIGGGSPGASPGWSRSYASCSATVSSSGAGRTRSGLANVTIVGYTNAGKSTLLNRLTAAGVLVEDRLFATLDPTTRRLSLPGGEPVLLTDTVGFVRRLPHGLIEAFKSTLELVAEADLLVHLVDASAPDPEAQIDAVHTVLAEIHADRVPELIVFNKADLAPEEAARQVKLRPGSVAISAVTGVGLEQLLTAVSDRLRAVGDRHRVAGALRPG